ncbi:phage late control D family protein, partial [Chondromyces apiculatus]|uniref:phage late control D family protein n=1 Tax=Chondromyces apiculatus TaxID=51 RepID=UPI0005C547B0
MAVGGERLLALELACGEAMEVHWFQVKEAVSALWSVRVVARCQDALLDLRRLVGEAAALEVVGEGRRWEGVCTQARLAEGVEVGEGEVGLSTYELRIAPRLWWLTQSTRYRVFRGVSTPAMVQEVLAGWGLGGEVRFRLREEHPRHPHRVQYGESDFDFVSRSLEEAGIAYCFSEAGEDEGEGAGGARVVLSDALHEVGAQGREVLRYVERPVGGLGRGEVTRVSVEEEVRPAGLLARDYDFQRPAWSLVGEAGAGREGAGRGVVERYAPGAFLVEGGGEGGGQRRRDRRCARKGRCGPR